MAQLEANVRVQHRAGVPSTLLTSDEVGALVPGLRAEGVAGASYCGEDGYFDRPQSVVAAFAEAARVRGARFERSQVISIARDGAGWRLETEGVRPTPVEQLVVAAAAETARLVAPLEVDLPIEREPRFLLLGEPRSERLLDPLVIAVDRGLAAKQLADGRLLASDLHATGDPETEADRWRANVRRELERLLPALAEEALPTVVQGDLRHDAGRTADRRRGRRRALGRRRLQRPRLHGRTEHGAPRRRGARR